MGAPPLTLPLEKRPSCTEETGYCCIANTPHFSNLGTIFILLENQSRTHQEWLTSLGNSTRFSFQDGGITQLVSLLATNQELGFLLPWTIFQDFRVFFRTQWLCSKRVFSEQKPAWRPFHPSLWAHSSQSAPTFFFFF